MSTRRRRFSLVLCAFLGLLLLVWQVMRSGSPTEPRVRGKPLRFWLRALYSNDNTRSTEATSAIQELGTNSIPFLLDLLKTEDTPAIKAAVWLNLHFKLIRLPVMTASQWHNCAIRAVKALGWRADPFIPEFQKLLDSSNTAQFGVTLLSFCQSNAIPALCVALTNSNPDVRLEAAHDLGMRHVDAASVVPVLLQSLKDSNPRVRNMSAYALSRFPDEIDQITPALIDALQDSEVEVRLVAAQSLGEFGPRASNAVPALIQLLREENNMAAPAALTKISPEAARSIGREVKLPESFE